MLTEERYNKIQEALKNKGTITVAEMTMMTKEAIGITFSPLIVYICAGVLYWALNLVIEFASRCIEKHNNRVAI